MIENKTYCKNCNSELTDAYCQRCGQRASVGRITFSETLADFFETVFSVDAPFFVTLKLLFKNPGQLFRSYLNGRRKAFYKPVAFFILITIVYILTRSFLNVDPMAKVSSYQNGEVDTAKMVLAGKFMVQNINNFLFIFVFSMAIALKTFFYRKHLLAEYLAISFYLVGAYTIFATLNLFFWKFINDDIRYLAILFMMVYFIFAAVSFFQKRKLLVAFKALFSYIVATILYIIFAFSLSFIIVLLKAN